MENIIIHLEKFVLFFSSFFTSLLQTVSVYLFIGVYLVYWSLFAENNCVEDF